MEQIKNIQDLLNHFDADTPGGLNRRIDKDTGCGASISLYLSDGRQFHNGHKNLATWPSAEEIEQTGLSGFTIQTIVEGSERTVDSDLFSLPCETAAVDRFIAWMEEQADSIWQEANAETEADEGEKEKVRVRPGRFVMDSDATTVAEEGEEAEILEWQQWPEGLRPVVQFPKGKLTVCHMVDVEIVSAEGGEETL